MVGLALVWLRLSELETAKNTYADIGYRRLWMFGLGIVALPAGAGLAILLRYLRSDRAWIAIGFVLGFTSLAHVFALGHPPSQRAADVLLPDAYLWGAVGAFVLARWIRPAGIEQVADARWLAGGWPRLRRPTTIEVSVGLALGVAIACALGARMESVSEFSHWSKEGWTLRGVDAWSVLVALLPLLVPAAVGLGAITPKFPAFLRWVCIPMAALIAYSCIALHIAALGPIAFAWWSPYLATAAVFALVAYGSFAPRPQNMCLKLM